MTFTFGKFAVKFDGDNFTLWIGNEMIAMSTCADHYMREVEDRDGQGEWKTVVEEAARAFAVSMLEHFAQVTKHIAA